MKTKMHLHSAKNSFHCIQIAYMYLRIKVYFMHNAKVTPYQCMTAHVHSLQQNHLMDFHNSRQKQSGLLLV